MERSMLQSVVATAPVRIGEETGLRPGRPRHGTGTRQTRRSRAVFAAALLGLLAAPQLVSAQSAGEWRDASHLYSSSCTYCHDTGVGPNLRGVGWPKEYVAVRVRMGYQAMPAFKPSEISEAEIAALAAWLADQPLPPGPEKAGATRP
jgi:mono/diheme cytochrome c family protein